MSYVINKIYKVIVPDRSVPWESYWIFKPTRDDVLAYVDQAFPEDDAKHLRERLKASVSGGSWSISERDCVEEQL
jgi:hypothetical protein